MHHLTHLRSIGRLISTVRTPDHDLPSCDWIYSLFDSSEYQKGTRYYIFMYKYECKPLEHGYFVNSKERTNKIHNPLNRSVATLMIGSHASMF
jgi:hypothetical protein